MDPQFDIIFYNRHFSAEIATGSYLVKNTPYSIQLLKEFSEYEKKLPQDSFHGTDNGAIHVSEWSALNYKLQDSLQKLQQIPLSAYNFLPHEKG